MTARMGSPEAPRRATKAGPLPALFLVILARIAPAATAQQPPTASPDPRAVVGTPNAQPLAGELLEARTKEVSSLLRCPVCQGLSVWDSPATMAVNMKHEVRSLLAKGYDQQQILAYFKSSYGEFVLLEPPKKGINLLVWVLPVALLVAGGFVVWRMMTRAAPLGKSAANTVAATAPALPGRDTLPDDPALARYVLAVREIAYGWPGGRSPEPDASSEEGRA